jgi:hypothetical protein
VRTAPARTAPARTARRLTLLVLTCASLASTVGFAGVADAAPARTYTVTRTVGPYSGTTREGDAGYPQTNGEADVALCRRGDTAVRGHARINHRTAHGPTRYDVLRLDRSGVTHDSESGYNVFYQFISPNGRKGWNSVTLTVTCQRR